MYVQIGMSHFSRGNKSELHVTKGSYLCLIYVLILSFKMGVGLEMWGLKGLDK